MQFEFTLAMVLWFWVSVGKSERYRVKGPIWLLLLTSDWRNVAKNALIKRFYEHRKRVPDFIKWLPEPTKRLLEGIKSVAELMRRFPELMKWPPE